MENKNVAESLLPWYKIHARQLPFRQNKNAYSIWVSEIMAQQTRIEAMLGKHAAFMARFPTIEALAAASEEELHKAWQGLGYYARVRNLQKAARICMESYGGQLPESYAKLLELPGIGPYTAGAIASIAFDENTAAVDGNVIRIFSRLYDIHEDVRVPAVQRKITALVNASLPGSAHISDYNQALMDLGAMVCIPASPRCAQCPLQEICTANAKGTARLLPVKKALKKRSVEQMHLYIPVFLEQGKLYTKVYKRPAEGLLAGMYGFAQAPDPAWHVIQEESWRTSVHIFTHKEWHMTSSLVYCADKAGLESLEEIEKHLAVASAYMPFVQGLVKMEEDADEE